MDEDDNLIDMSDPAIQTALSALSDLERDFAAVELDASMSLTAFHTLEQYTDFRV